MKRFFSIVLALLALTGVAAAQLVTTTPSPLQESSQGVVLTYNANSSLGNRGLANLSSSVDVYAHIGVITNKSANSSDWKYTVTPWPNTGDEQAANTDKNRLTYVAANTYSLEIGDLRTYFGMSDPTEYIKQIAIVFRNADGSKEGKTSRGGDIFVDVLFDGFAIELSADYPDRVISGPTDITFTLQSTQAADLALSVNGKQFASKTGTTSLSAKYSFTEAGNYIVEGSTTYNGVKYSESIEISYPDASMRQDYPGGVPKMGAVKNADGTVTFCLAAPGKFSVVLVPSWDNYEILDKNLMKYQDYEGNRYFWTTVSGLADDQWYSYYYVVDDTYKVADPYAHLVLDCYNDRYINRTIWPDSPKHPGSPYENIMMAAYRGDIDNYEFSDFTIPAHDNLVIYEMLFRDFTGINGAANGAGTVKKAIEKIPYIKNLGFNAVELMPIMEFNGNNSWGYNTNFYMAPDKAYGSPKDYKDFIEECHRNGIAVILDIVFNQSDGLHPWYQMYPIDTNPFYNKTAPHAWSVLNDWNQGHPLVQQQWTDALKYWLEKYNVDGFRFDLVKGLGDNDSYSAGTDAYNQNRIDRMIRLHNVIKSVKPDGIHINELLAGAQEEKVLGEDGQLQWANINDASCHYTMGWDDGNNNLNRFLSSSDSGRPWGSTVSYAESHDEQRMGFKCISFGSEPVIDDETVMYNRLAALAVQMLLTPGPKMVWMFGELGNTQNAKSKPDGSGDNDTSPKIVDWRWLDDPHKKYLMDTYAAMINLRMINPELMDRNATFSPSGLGIRFNRGRTMRLTAGDKEIIAFINPAISGDALAVEATPVNLSPENSQLIWASDGFTPELKASGSNVSVTVPANGFAVYASKAVTGVEAPEAVSPSVPKAFAVGGAGEIVIVGEYSSVDVFDLSGRQMSSLHVPAGVYIVRIDGHASKVAVR